MNMKEILRKLCRVTEPGGTVVTLAFDRTKAGASSAATRKSIQKQLAERLKSEGRAAPAGEAWESLSRKIFQYVDNDLHPETKGLFLVAGREVWEAIELKVPVQNFVHLGETAYVAPLLEAAMKAPRTYVLSYDQREAILEEAVLGEWNDVVRLSSTGVEENTEHLATGRAGAGRAGKGRTPGGMGGGGRDRFDQHFEDAAETLLQQAAARVAALHKDAPSEAIYAFGDREHFPFFRDHLPVGLRSQAVHVGPLPHRHEDILRKAVGRELDLLAQGAIDRAVTEFGERRAEGCHVALGPGEVLPFLGTGKVTRIFLDPSEPLMGGLCPECAALYEGPRERCDPCGKPLTRRSLTQEVVARAVLHPPLPLTLLPASQAWLKELGGMAALLSAKGVRAKR